MINIPEEFILHSPTVPFPDIDSALEEPSGLIAIGGELSTERLLDAYQKGIFPWYSEGEPVLWYSPNPRMVITKEALHVSKSLDKVLRSNRFEVRTNTNFEQVIHQCKNIKRKDQDSTWIDNDMVQAYIQLHHQGHAHSIEVYENSQLAGGLYGVAIGKVFFGESMFSCASNASKVALVHLLKNTDYQLIDCQVENPHLKSLGAFNIERSAFVQQLRDLL
ncbi:MAG: leucyl/phenylalanyl-tRNA--protein transferase [Candidatus Thioglobus sp.]|nr:MAG: leucyl/phenylalanyl-tRNA--protein transferase [Candidatus Thioglobus sp.]RUM79121.1 MAG: leucyl/phenylalanyl-tRNA--protein transferase [Candidatus Thioglobus sp.]RUM83460.1 MAG: leucyl/phenylalanyl-tRNA--protein transferase [Candidatus Thioglobus sp.]